MQTPPNPETLPVALKKALSRRPERIVVFSGAGMSADSGIPTFRSGQTGLWKEFNPTELATPNAWQRNSALVWGWYEWRRGIIMNAQPNPGHLAVARLQQALGASVITQNVDDLHERAGVSEVIHLHGSMFKPFCTACGRTHAFYGTPPDIPLLEIEPPRCQYCKASVRPGVVWFGEKLSPVLFAQAESLITNCDLLLVIGTSGVVQPAAGLVALAPSIATVIEVNPSSTPQSDRMNHVLRVSASQVLPAIVEYLVDTSS